MKTNSILGYFRKKNRVYIALLISVCCVFIAKFAVDNRAMIVYFKSANEIVDEQQLEKDVKMILGVYGLQKDSSRFINGEGDSIYDIYYKTKGGKSIFINAFSVLPASRKEYTEIKTLMEIWLYILSHKFNIDIEGVTYCFTARSGPFQLLSPTKVYMPKTEFLALYNDCVKEGFSHKKKIEILTNEYVAQKNYKRGSGHIQVDE